MAQPYLLIATKSRQKATCGTGAGFVDATVSQEGGAPRGPTGGRYHRGGMRTRRFTGPALPIVVLAASQVGHLLASELRAGPRTGAHAYVPALTTVVLGIAGAVALA